MLLCLLVMAQATIYGLGLNFKAAPQVQNSDITPDLSFLFSNNLLPSLNWEDNKGIGDKIWENDSSVAGQVFEQLMLTKCGIGGAAHGIVSTYNGVKLVSTEDWTKMPPTVLPQNATLAFCRSQRSRFASIYSWAVPIEDFFHGQKAPHGKNNSKDDCGQGRAAHAGGDTNLSGLPEPRVFRLQDV
jgi:hypothetical protein